MTTNHLRHQTPLARAMLLAFGVASGTALLPAVAMAADPAPARISTASLELEMTAAVQKALDKMPRIDGQGQHIKATVKLDRKRMRVLINLSEEFRPDDAGAELEDQLSWLHNAADWVLISKGLEPTGSEVTIGGQSLQKLFPEWFKVTPEKSPPSIRHLQGLWWLLRGTAFTTTTSSKTGACSGTPAMALRRTSSRRLMPLN